MQRSSATAAQDGDGDRFCDAGDIAGQRLSRQLAALAAVGVCSVALLVFQVFDAQADARRAWGARDRVAGEIDAAQRQLQALNGEVAAALARRAGLAEQVIASEKTTRRLEAEVAALTGQRTAALSAADEAVRRQQESERRAVEAAQRQAAVEAQIATARGELADIQARTAAVAAAAKPKTPARRSRPNDHTP